MTAGTAPPAGGEAQAPGTGAAGSAAEQGGAAGSGTGAAARAADAPPAPQDIAACWRALAKAPGQAATWEALARLYVAAELPWQSAYAARQALRTDPARLPALQALQIPRWQDATQGDALLGRAALPEAEALEQRFSAQVARHTGDWLTWLYLARLRGMLGAPQPAQVALEQARTLEPIAGESLHWLGVWRAKAGDAQGAVAAFSGLLDIRPVRTGSMMYLGEALLAVGNVQAAEKAFARASLSNNPEFLQALAGRVYGHNYWQEAIEVLRKALVLRPDHVPTLLALAKIQSEVYFLADCRATLDRLQQLDPVNAEARLLRAGMLGRMGDARGHLEMLQKAYAQGGDPLSRLASSIAMTSLYNDLLAPQEVADLHRRLVAPIEEACRGKGAPLVPRQAGGPLRVGLVTGDLHRQHPVNIFMLPLMQRMDRDRFRLHVYHTGTLHDHYTRLAQACAHRWVQASAMDDQALRRTIADDGVDVLIDLGGHTSSHRLGVFAMRAAPVQATFLGYPHSTGLSSIDWLVGDPVVSPEEHAALFSEGIAQLPHSVFCWSPVDPYPLPPARAAEAPVVFCSFNNAMKLSPRTVALWARVLQAVPGARLLLKAPSLRDPAVAARFAALFGDHGVAADRLEFRGPTGLAEMMQEYGDADIALDPMPYNGGTTTLQALWMGVPVVTLAGGNFVGRMGASFLAALHRPQWIAQDEDAYVAAAAALARDVRTVRSGRAALRAAMEASPVCDMAGYAKDFEALLATMWQRHLAGDARRLITPQDTGSALPVRPASPLQDVPPARTAPSTQDSAHGHA